MKKLLLLMIIVLLSVSTVAAYTFPNTFYDGRTFAPTSVRSEGMGGLGLGTSRGVDSLYINPANLAGQPFSLYVPSISLTAYNAKNIVDSGMIQDIIDGNAGEQTAMDYLETIEAAKGELLTTDIMAGFAGGGFGLTLNIQEKLHNLDKGIDTNLIAEVNASAGLGIAFSIPIINHMLSVDAGAVVRPTYTAFTQPIGAQGIIGTMFGGGDIMQSILQDNELAAGYAIPVDVGINVNGPMGVRLSAVARNLNGNYTLTRYSEAGAWVNEMLALVEQDPIYTDEAPAATSEALTIEVPWSLDIGFGWTPSFGGLTRILRPSLSVDLVDVVTFSQTAADDTEAIWNHLIAGAEIKLLSMIDVRAGLNKGYLSAGVGFDLLVLHVDAAYYWREFGANIGDRPVDAFSVRFNLGIDG